MASFNKESSGKWRVNYRFTDWSGAVIKSSKRGFKTKKEAIAWYEEISKEKEGSLNMSFATFVDSYLEDMTNRLKENTLITKKQLINKHILPYFKNRCVSEITAIDIRKWQSHLMGEDHYPTYLRAINSQLSSIFNYAVRFYDLKSNPCKKAGVMGSKNGEEKQFWSIDEFNSFCDGLYDNQIAYVAFRVLFWTGIRIGELLALNYKDFDLNAKTVKITKSYQKIKGKDVITSPKTAKSTRTVGLPDFLVEDLEEYFERIYEVKEQIRIFPFAKDYFMRVLIKACKRTEVKKIRLHDLRHSHASLLVNMGLSTKAIADRLGHERIETTLNTYSHLYKSTQDLIVDNLEKLNDKSED